MGNVKMKMIKILHLFISSWFFKLKDITLDLIAPTSGAVPFHQPFITSL